jgi:poly-gamma-glutamate synthesis protein (capsule biosynthesis protein)
MLEIIRETNAAYTNMEVLLHDYEGYPAANSGGTWMRADPQMAEELAWAGFDMVSLANNHTLDYGVGGLRATIDALNAADLIWAGAGMNLARARAPHYMETDGGRVAIISVASTFTEGWEAGSQGRTVEGRPGLSPLRYRTTYTVSENSMEALR